MANARIFNYDSHVTATWIPPTDTTNEAGGTAYSMSDKHALAQYATTGTLNDTYYTKAEDQLKAVLDLCSRLSSEYIAQVAVYARRKGYMKDLPALLCAVLAARKTEDARIALTQIFPVVINSGKMIRNFVQIVRSGVTGRKSLGSLPKRLIQDWFARSSGDYLFRESVGQSPSLVDIIKMVHPKPASKEKQCLYYYLTVKPKGTVSEDFYAFPKLVQQYESFSHEGRVEGAASPYETPDVPFEMLTALPLKKEHWKSIARKAGWHMTRMNLNTFTRHGVFDDHELHDLICNRLRNKELITGSRVFPYQLLAAYLNTEGISYSLKEALQDALEISLANVPEIKGQVIVLPDVSGSMSNSVTGTRKGSTSKVRCIDVAGLISAAFLRSNSPTRVIPFEGQVVSIDLNPRDSVMTNATKLASIGGGSTNCSAPLAFLNQQKAMGNLVIFVSDNESWVDSRVETYTSSLYKSSFASLLYSGNRKTRTMEEWNKFKQRNPNAKLVCIDITPNSTTQAVEREDILNIGGFSDNVFKLIADFASGKGKTAWVEDIEKIALDNLKD